MLEIFLYVVGAGLCFVAGYALGHRNRQPSLADKLRQDTHGNCS